jgi:uncharacterized protein
MAAERIDLRIPTGDGITLAGWWYSAGPQRGPAIVVSHGFSVTRAMGLDGYARVFQEAGFHCVVYDHRGYGDSDGAPRCETSGWQQVHDMRDVITWLTAREDVDPERIGLWGTSFAGGHALTVGALDRRVRAVVSQVPFVRGADTYDLWVPRDRQERFAARLDADRAARAAGSDPQTAVAAPEGSETAEWVATFGDPPPFENRVTIRSFEMIREYEPGQFISRVSPTPLLMVIAANDTQTPTEWQLEAFEHAGEPKELVTLQCRHYDPYVSHFQESAAAARDWYLRWL